MGSFSAANFSLTNATGADGQRRDRHDRRPGSHRLTTTSGALAVQRDLTGGAIVADIGRAISRWRTNLTGSTVSLSFRGQHQPERGVIQATTLTGSAAGSATLAKANKVGTLGTFSATNGLTFANAQALTVGGNVTVAVSTTLSTTAGKLTVAGSVGGRPIDLAGQGGLAINGAVNAGVGDIALTSAGGAISQGSGGTLTAGSLSGSSAGSTALGGANQVVTLGNFTTGGNFSFRDTRTLTVNSPLSVNGGNGDLSLTTTR